MQDKSDDDESMTKKDSNPLYLYISHTRNVSLYRILQRQILEFAGVVGIDVRWYA